MKDFGVATRYSAVAIFINFLTKMIWAATTVVLAIRPAAFLVAATATVMGVGTLVTCQGRFVFTVIKEVDSRRGIEENICSLSVFVAPDRWLCSPPCAPVLLLRSAPAR